MAEGKIAKVQFNTMGEKGHLMAKVYLKTLDGELTLNEWILNNKMGLLTMGFKKIDFSPGLSQNLAE